MMRAKILILTIIMFGNMLGVSQEQTTFTEQEALNFFNAVKLFKRRY